MTPDEVTIEVLDRDLRRQAQILPDYWDCKTVSTFRGVGEWEMNLPADLPAARTLSRPGSSILITGPEGELFSGPVTAPGEKAGQSDPGGTLTLTGTDWNVLLQDSLAWPTPTTADYTAQTSAYDVRKGPAETAIRGLIDANIGPSAPAARRGWFAQKLTLEPDQGRGGNVTISSRFDNVLAQAAAAAKTGAVGYRIEVRGLGLLLRFTEPADRSATVRLDIDNGTLTSYEYNLAAPTVTYVIVAGQGEAEARTFRARTTTAATDAEALWGRRVETFKDQRNTDDPDELDAAGDEILADGGATRTDLKLTPSESTDGMQYQRDYQLGDYITATIRDTEIPQLIAQVGAAYNQAGVTIGIKNGDLETGDLARLASRVRNLETRY